MSLPIHDEIERVLAARPNDDIFPKIKPILDETIRRESGVKENLVSLIIDDMVQDFALANSLDRIGEVIEYLTQESEIEKPEFSGKALMADLGRISRLKTSLEYAKTIGLDGAAYDAVLKAEVARLWQSDSTNALKQLLAAKAAAPTTGSSQ
jgi:hypothetical protein